MLITLHYQNVGADSDTAFHLFWGNTQMQSELCGTVQYGTVYRRS